MSILESVMIIAARFARRGSFVLFLFTSLAYAAPSDDFVITINTETGGPAPGTQFEIPTRSSEYTYNYNVDCDNDGIDEATGVTGNYTCDYPAPGIYTIRIKDNTGTGDGFPAIHFGSSGDGRKVLSVNQWGTGHWVTMQEAFSGCVYLSSARVVDNGGGSLPDWAADEPDLSNVTSMSGMFYNAASFNQDISGWDVSNVQDMSRMFRGAAFFNQDIGGWNVSNVVDMSWMFAYAASFNQDIGGWDVSNVQDMYAMFVFATSFNQDIGGWDVSNVLNMSGMFYNASSFNQDISGWGVSNVQYMYAMFDHATSFNQDIGGWDVSNVQDMSGMFYNASSFNQDISGWDVSNAQDMSWMFYDAASFDQDISGWDVSRVFNMYGMLGGSGLSSQNYDNLLNGWSMQSLQSGVILHVSAPFCASENQKQSIMTNYNWVIYDMGKQCDSDVDRDGIADAQEDSVAGGDANGDGIPDKTQANVRTLSSATGNGYLTIEVPDYCGMYDVEAVAESTSHPDSNWNFPYGLIAFKLLCYEAQVKIYFHSASELNGYTYRKYGPTPPAFNTAAWYTLPDVSYGQANIGAQVVPYATFILRDGELGDDTPGDWFIVDQGGPALPFAGPAVVSIPAMNKWGVLLTGLFLLLTYTIIARRKA